MKIVIVYHSVTGTTAQLAEAVAAGCRSATAVDLQLLRIEGEEIYPSDLKMRVSEPLGACNARQPGEAM